MTAKLALALACSLAFSRVAAADKKITRQPERIPVTTLKSFDYGRTYVHTDERKELFVVAQLWRQRPSWTVITIQGHGYVENDEEASVALGQARADRVRRLLIRWGVDPRYIVAIGNSRETPGRYADISVQTCDHCRP